jgi:DNA-binding transcriptional ArsR family regulator
MEVTELENIASLIGEPARIKMLWSLLDGRAYTATELSYFSNTSPQSASMHLAKLVQASLLKVSVQGRHRYYSFATDEVAFAIESIGGLVPKHKILQRNLSEQPIRYCRTCYDHLAGKVGVIIHDKILEKNYLVKKEDSYVLTSGGEVWFSSMGIDIPSLIKKRRTFVKPCLDWSERRYHLAGTIGASLLSVFLERDFVRRKRNSREIIVTTQGRHGLRQFLQIDI